MSERNQHIYMARVYLNQAKSFRIHGNFHAVLLGWAASRRKSARQFQPMQGYLFS